MKFPLIDTKAAAANRRRIGDQRANEFGCTRHYQAEANRRLATAAHKPGEGRRV